MSMFTHMQVHLRLPARTLFEGPAVSLTATAANGSFGILPNHIDYVTALVPSVLLIVMPGGEEKIFGIDEGLLVKKGQDVDLAVRRGVPGDDLETLRQTVDASFTEMEEEERVARAALSRLEADMVRRFTSLRRPHP